MIDLSDNGKIRSLVNGCIQGNKNCQQKFYQTFYGKMLAICMRYADNREEAKDILHDGFIKVFANLKEFEFKGSLEGWVKRIVTNTAIDTIRKKKNFFVELDENRNYDTMIEDYQSNADFEQFTKIKVDTIMQLIQKLSPMYRTVFNLFVFEEMTHKEIAEQLNINIGTSKSNFAKARKNLIKLFEEHTNGHEQ
ncbi:MAG TPA: sigma-70 family RNA polymerase sigma factor [Bacteroidales bacterium]|nr:sigma-70 family RNA polymerase sigma factor [Bacteroidales bacterium]HPS18047.1 sigma-70 family RNA polymerase sigma factor [Bacteroidales bacterium]